MEKLKLTFVEVTSKFACNAENGLICYFRAPFDLYPIGSAQIWMLELAWGCPILYRFLGFLDFALEMEANFC
jgi:hypothetical protein